MREAIQVFYFKVFAAKAKKATRATRKMNQETTRNAIIYSEEQKSDECRKDNKFQESKTGYD